MLTLKNENLTVGLDAFGAELASIKDSAGREYIWQGNPAIWSGHAPVLFPIAGRLLSDSYVYGGKKYYLPKHGFARKCQFAIYSQDDSHAVFTLASTEDTKRVYPFDFLLTVEFALKGKTLTATHTVHNIGKGNMYFSLGAHPAFNIEIGDRVVFSEKESFTTHLFNELGLSEGTADVAKDTDSITITDHIFDGDALFFEGLESTSATVVSKKDGALLKMTYGKAPLLGLWAKPGAPYVCIEPWYGFCDNMNVTGKLEEKPHIKCLGADEEFCLTYTIDILQ
ncbi:MAG: aldose 1-epimerase family protein [Clostridia bacterium]|nr:aldose 1-epimerase family protein [Clostridia bacterium]